MRVLDDIVDVQIGLGCAVFVRGAPAEQREALAAHLAAVLEFVDFGSRRYRRGAAAEWRQMPSAPAALLAEWRDATPHPGGRVLQIRPDEQGSTLVIAELPAVGDVERVGYLGMHCPASTGPSDLIRVTDRLLQAPFWWATAGHAYRRLKGSPFNAARRTAALAKRYWGAQIVDLQTLQSDALRGMPGVNWLSAIGSAFAADHGMTVAGIAAATDADRRTGVFHRIGAHGVALAAGSEPLSGDINVDEELTSYARVAEILEPLLLKDQARGPGPWADPHLSSAWLRRFIDPKGWLDADIDV